ncbi:MAG: hypothetical protein AAGF93_17765 [Cyanobacteria bacterium P01_H01_bin.105]
MVHILVTASQRRLAAILDKGLQLQGWRTCMADTYDAVVGNVVHNPINLVLVDADCFQAKTLSLVRTLQHQQISLIVIAADYQVSNNDLRQIIATEDILIKPFSIKHLVDILDKKLSSTDSF